MLICDDPLNAAILLSVTPVVYGCIQGETNLSLPVPPIGCDPRAAPMQGAWYTTIEPRERERGAL